MKTIQATEAKNRHYHKQSRKELVRRYHEESIERFAALFEALAK